MVQQGFTEAEADLVIEFVYENCLSHQEFVKHLIDTEVSQVFAIDTEV